MLRIVECFGAEVVAATQNQAASALVFLYERGERIQIVTREPRPAMQHDERSAGPRSAATVSIPPAHSPLAPAH